MVCVPIILMLGWDILPCLERAFQYGTKCCSPQLGFPGCGQGWAALGGWVGKGRLICTPLSTTSMGAKEKGAQPGSLCSAALQEGKARWGFGHLQPPSVALSTSAWVWSSCYHHPINPSTGAEPPALALPLPQTEVKDQLQWPATAGVDQKTEVFLQLSPFCNNFLAHINKPSFLLHIEKGEHDSFDAASIFRC